MDEYVAKYPGAIQYLLEEEKERELWPGLRTNEFSGDLHDIVLRHNNLSHKRSSVLDYVTHTIVDIEDVLNPEEIKNKWTEKLDKIRNPYHTMQKPRNFLECIEFVMDVGVKMTKWLEFGAYSTCMLGLGGLAHAYALPAFFAKRYVVDKKLCALHQKLEKQNG
jgi:hypothetical protein